MSRASVFKRAMDVATRMDAPEAPWVDLLETFQEVIGADSATLLVFEGNALVTSEATGVDAAALGAYQAHFHKHDYGLSDTPRPTGTWLDSQTLLSPHERQRNHYYVDFMCRYRMRQIGMFVMSETGTRSAAISFQRESPRDLSREVATLPMARYSSTLAGALEKRRRAADRWTASVDEAFSAFGEAIALLTRSGVIVHLSAMAQEMLAHDGVFSVVAGRLCGRTAAATGALLDAIRRLSPESPTSKLVLRSADGTAPLSLQIAYAPPIFSIGKEPVAMLRMRPLQPRLAPDGATLAALFGVTRSEARIWIALMSGHSPIDCAHEFGVSINTIRKQIATLKDKTACSTQVELVAKGRSSI